MTVRKGIPRLGKHRKGFTVHTYPMPWTGLTGLPCRVVVEGEVSPS